MLNAMGGFLCADALIGSNSPADDRLPEDINGAVARMPDPKATFRMKDLRFVFIINIY
jgi:hypothetical protein